MRANMSPRARILSIAPALPKSVRTNDWWDAIGIDERGDVLKSPADQQINSANADPEIAARFVREASDPFMGTVERRVLEESRTPSDLEVEACELAIKRSGIPRSQIDALISFSHLTDVAAPTNTPVLVERLGLESKVLGLTADREGASFPLHLELADQLIGSGRYRHVLCVQSSVMSRLVSPSHLTSRLIGDAAVATLLGPADGERGFIGAKHLTLGDHYRMAQLLPASSPREPWYRGDRHQDALVWQSPDRALSQRVGLTLATVFESVVRPLLDEHGVSPDQVRYLASYEPRSWIAQAFAERLGMPSSKTVSRFRDVGYTLAASAGLCVEKLYTQSLIQPKDLILVYSEGAGVSCSAVLLRA